MKKFLRRLSSAVLNILLTISAIIFVILLIGNIQFRAFDKLVRKKLSWKN